MSAARSIEPGTLVVHTPSQRSGRLVDRYRVALVYGDEAILVRNGSATTMRVELAQLAASPEWELTEAPR